MLVGQSGCGKTTLLHVIAGISRADQGSVRLDGIEVSRLSEAGRDRFRADKIGYVFQTFNLLPGFTALENVMLGMTFARSRRIRTGHVAAGPRRLAASATTGPRRCRSASNSGWPWPGRWPTAPRCSWPTSRRPTSTRPISSRSST